MLVVVTFGSGLFVLAFFSGFLVFGVVVVVVVIVAVAVAAAAAAAGGGGGCVKGSIVVWKGMARQLKSMSGKGVETGGKRRERCSTNAPSQQEALENS